MRWLGVINLTWECEAQWPIGYGVGLLRIKLSSARIRPWPLRWVLGQDSLLSLSQEAFTLASISYLAILVNIYWQKIYRSQSTNQSADLNERLPNLCFAICRFSQVRFITPATSRTNFCFISNCFWYYYSLAWSRVNHNGISKTGRKWMETKSTEEVCKLAGELEKQGAKYVFIVCVSLSLLK